MRRSSGISLRTFLRASINLEIRGSCLRKTRSVPNPRPNFTVSPSTTTKTTTKTTMETTTKATSNAMLSAPSMHFRKLRYQKLLSFSSCNDLSSCPYCSKDNRNKKPNSCYSSYTNRSSFFNSSNGNLRGCYRSSDGMKCMISGSTINLTV